MHWSGEVSLGTIIGVVTLSFAIGALFLRLGGLQQVLERLLKDMDVQQVVNDQFAKALESHIQHDEHLFRELTAAINRMIGKLGGN